MITKYKFISFKDYLSGIDESESVNQDYDADDIHDYDSFLLQNGALD